MDNFEILKKAIEEKDWDTALLQMVTFEQHAVALERALVIMQFIHSEPTRFIGKITPEVYDWAVTHEYAVRFQNIAWKEKHGETMWEYYLTEKGEKLYEFLFGEEDV